MINYRERTLVSDIDIEEPSFSTDIQTHQTYSGLSLDVAIADGRKEKTDPTVLFFLPWSEYVARPDASDRYRVMAETMGARVIALDNLGVGNGTSELPPAIAKDVVKGNFMANAETQLEVVKDGLGVNLGHAALFGYSLGAGIAASFAKAMDEKDHIDRLTLMETVGARQQSMGALALRFALESIRWNRAYINNDALQVDWMSRPGSDPTMLRRMRKTPAAYYAYPRGLSTGSAVVPNLEAAFEHGVLNDRSTIGIIHGSKSIVSPRSENEYLADRLWNMNVATVSQTVLLNESHGILDAPRKFIQTLRD